MIQHELMIMLYFTFQNIGSHCNAIKWLTDKQREEPDRLNRFSTNRLQVKKKDIDADSHYEMRIRLLKTMLIG